MDEALYGMVVDVLEEPAPGWYRVRTPYRYEGTASAAHLLVGDEGAAAWAALPKQVVRNKNFCDVLSQPKVQGWHLATLTRGCVVSPVGQAEDGWQKVLLADGRTGFVQASILEEHFTAPCRADEAGPARRPGGCSHAVRRHPLPLGGQVSHGHRLLRPGIHGLPAVRHLHLPGRQDRGGIPHPRDRPGDMKPGDLLFFPGHVAMYLGDGRYCHSTGRAGDDGFTVNSLDPAAPDYRADLAEKITAVGSYFS